jgi:hypothetical protein
MTPPLRFTDQNVVYISHSSMRATYPAHLILLHLIKLLLCLIKHHTMNTYGGEPRHQREVSGQLNAPVALTLEEKPLVPLG